MNPTTSIKTSLVLSTITLASCWTAPTQAPIERPPVPINVSVDLAAVTLGDECGDGWTPNPPILPVRKPSQPFAQPPTAMAPARNAPASAEPAVDSPYYSRGRHYCEQTSMQLVLDAGRNNAGTAIQIKRVELLDEEGRVLGRLEARAPTRWVGDHYAAWDQRVFAGQQVAASYALTSPEWDSFEGGRWAQQGRSFQLRVIVAVGSDERTIEKQSISPAMMEPAVPT